MRDHFVNTTLETAEAAGAQAVPARRIANFAAGVEFIAGTQPLRARDGSRSAGSNKMHPPL